MAESCDLLGGGRRPGGQQPPLNGNHWSPGRDPIPADAGQLDPGQSGPAVGGLARPGSSRPVLGRAGPGRLPADAGPLDPVGGRGRHDRASARQELGRVAARD